MLSGAITTREDVGKKLRQVVCFQIDHAEKDVKLVEEIGEILEALCEDLLSFTLDIACHVLLSRTMIR
jgi:hypothetical protein